MGLEPHKLREERGLPGAPITNQNELEVPVGGGASELAAEIGHDGPRSSLLDLPGRRGDEPVGVQLQDAEVPAVGEVGAEGGEPRQALELQEGEVGEEAHPLRDLAEALVVGDVDPVERVDTWVQIVACQVVNQFCLVVVNLLIRAFWCPLSRDPLVLFVPGSVQDAVLGVHQAIVG